MDFFKRKEDKVKRIVFLILAVVLLASAMVASLNLEKNVYEGIAFYYDQGLGTSNNRFAIHDSAKGDFIANISTNDICAFPNVVCPLHIWQYYGFIPKNGDHIIYTRYYLNWRWEDWSSITGVTLAFTKKLDDIKYADPKFLEFHVDCTTDGVPSDDCMIAIDPQ